MKLFAICILTIGIAALPAAGGAADAKPPAKELKLQTKLDSMHEAGVGPVIYPHAFHEKLYKCADCHPNLFKEKVGASGISMKANMDGNFCGSPKCHDSETAFPLYYCSRCHTEITAGKKK